MYYATLAILNSHRLLDYVQYSRNEGKGTCLFRFKHDSWFADTDSDITVSASVSCSFVEGKGVAVTATFGFSGALGFTDTIRGYVSDGDLAHLIASFFEALSRDGMTRSYYIDAWDDFSIALSNMSEHPGFASEVKDSTAQGLQGLEDTPAALADMYDELTDRALRWYRIEFTDVTRRNDFFAVAHTFTIYVPTAESQSPKTPYTPILCDIGLRASVEGSGIRTDITMGLQAIPEGVSYESSYAVSGYTNTLRVGLHSRGQIKKFITSFLSLLGNLQADGCVYDHYVGLFEKFVTAVDSKKAVVDGVRSTRAHSTVQSQPAGLSLQEELALVQEHADEIMRAANIPYTRILNITPYGDTWVFRYLNKAGVPMVVYFGRYGEGSSMGRSVAVRSRIIHDLLRKGTASLTVSKRAKKEVVSDAASDAASLQGLSPIESMFGGSTLYRILLWPGRGYYRDVFYVRADSEESALEALSAYLIKEGLTSYYYTEDEYADYLREAGISEEEDTSYIYIDGTMDGAPYPIYLLSENLRIEEV